MRKFALGIALAAVALFTASSAASATIFTPIGTSATATGTVSFRGNILTATCSMSLSGRVASSTTLSVTSGSGSCNLGGLTLQAFPWTQTIFLDGTWEIGTIKAVVAVPLVGDCTYEGTLGGVWVPAEGSTELIILDELSNVAKTGGSSLCIDDPEVGGSLTVTPLEVG